MLTLLFRTFIIGSITISLIACSGNRPSNLGGLQGTLAPCPDSPNCVSSMADKSDDEHYIDAIASTEPAKTLAAIETELKNHPAEVIFRSDNYLYAEFTSKVMRYVDDVEFLYVPGKPDVQVRSASRLGYRDFGVNRERIEAIRTAVK